MNDSRQTCDGADRPARVVVVDDSAVMRNLLTQVMSSDPRLEVVATASDAYTARKEIKSLKPDVITLDVQMPQMDGIQFLRNLMRLHPMPVVMVSAFTVRGAEVTLQALELGAVDVVAKPVARGSDLHQFSFVHHTDPCGDGHGLLLIMGYHDKRCTNLLLD